MVTLPHPAHLVGGQWLDEAAEHVDVVGPADGEPLLSAPVAGVTVVDRAVRAATEALEGPWGRRTPALRAAAMLRLADAMEADLPTLVALECLDLGKPVPHATAEIRFAIDLIRFAAGAGRALSGIPAGEYVAGKTSYVRREPIGVVAGILPWNYPVVMLAYKLGASLAAGNTVVLKPAEQTPLSTLRIAELAREALEPGVLNVVLGDGESTGAALVEHPGVALVTLTGDTATGRLVARNAAATLKRTVLELGGKSPVLVCADADLELAADGVRHGGFYNAGQDCTAASRVIVHQDVHEDFVELLVKKVAQVRVGAPEHDADMGPVVTADQADRVMGFLTRAQEQGATIARGGNRLERAGFFIEPTVVVGAGQGDDIIQREVFGPVVTVQAARDEDEMIAMANGTEYGLGASVWTRNTGRAADLTGRVRAGAVWVNCHDVVTPEMPHGGLRASGYGKDLSVHSIEEMTMVKHVMVNHAR